MKITIKLLAMLTALLMAQTVVAQTVFSPNVNGMRSHYQNRRAKAAAAPADKERGFFVVTCSLDASPAAIANQMIGLGGIIRSLMANQILVELPMSQLDAAAAIDGVLLIDAPADGSPKTDKSRKASHVDEVHEGKAEGLNDLPQAYTGKGVIIGLIDGGFDYTHPMFKDQDGKLRIKGVYRPYTRPKTYSEPLENIQITDEKGVTTAISLTGSFVTNPDVILDTLEIKDKSGSHGTHCASIAAGRIMDYTPTFVARDENSGKLGGMAPDAELFLCENGVSDYETSMYGNLSDDLLSYNKMQSLYAMKHFARQQGKPLVVSISSNNHEGLHDGSSTMARYIGNYCKEGNLLTLCSSNEADDSIYLARNITKGNSVSVWHDATASVCKSNFLFRTDKEIKVDLAIADAQKNIIKRFNLPLTSKSTKKFEQELWFVVDLTTNLYDDNDEYYDDVCKELCHYIYDGYLRISINAGGALDKNYQPFPNVHVKINTNGLKWKGDYYLMPIISSPENDVYMQAWSEDQHLYANSVERPNEFLPGSSDHSMGDWCTSGEAVVVGAYVTDNRRLIFLEDFYRLVESSREKTGKVTSYSSYGTDFSAEHLAYPDVVAPGYNIYAAGNSFAPRSVYSWSAYSDQFKGQQDPRDYPYALMNGTSMSTPAVAGIVALWVQAAMDKGKTLTNRDIKDIIRHSSEQDEWTQSDPLRYGAGKINAYKGLLYVLDMATSVPELPTRHIAATLQDRTLHIQGDQNAQDAQVTIYNLSGQKVLDTHASSGIVELHALPTGVYAVKIGNQGSTLIRL